MSIAEVLNSVDISTGRLENAVQSLAFIVDQISHQMLVAKGNNDLTSPGWVLQGCSGLFVLERELQSIIEELSTIIQSPMEQEEVK